MRLSLAIAVRVPLARRVVPDLQPVAAHHRADLRPQFPLGVLPRVRALHFRAAQLRGGKPLEPETSVNTTAGLVVDAGPFTLTADYSRVDVSNRLALSQTFTLTDDDRSLLLSEGTASAGTLAFFRFFINDFSSRNQGIDLVSTYEPPGLGGDTGFSFTLNHTHTELTEGSDLLTAGDVLGLERGVPRIRWNAAINQKPGRVGVLGRLNYFGAWVDHFDARFVRGAYAPILDGFPRLGRNPQPAGAVKRAKRDGLDVGVQPSQGIGKGDQEDETSRADRCSGGDHGPANGIAARAGQADRERSRHDSSRADGSRRVRGRCSIGSCRCLAPRTSPVRQSRRPRRSSNENGPNARQVRSAKGVLYRQTAGRHQEGAGQPVPHAYVPRQVIAGRLNGNVAAASERMA